MSQVYWVGQQVAFSKWIERHGIETDQGVALYGSVMRGAVRYSNIECMKLLLANGCPLGSGHHGYNSMVWYFSMFENCASDSLNAFL